MNDNLPVEFSQILNNPNIQQCSYNFYNGTHMLIVVSLVNNIRTFTKYVGNGVILQQHTFQVNPFITLEQRNAEIRRLYTQEGLLQIELSNIFGLHQTTISRIVNS